MKKILFLIILCLNLVIVYSQDSDKDAVNKQLLEKVFTKTSDSNLEYCQIVGTSKFMSKKVTIEIDFGQETTLFDDMRLKDDKGKPKSFNSMIDALNYMGKFGWEFAQAYVISTSNQNVYHFLIKRIKKS